MDLATRPFIEDFSLYIKQCYCITVRSVEKNTESKKLWNWVVGSSKKLKYIKLQEASELLSKLGIKTPLCKISLVGPLL